MCWYSWLETFEGAGLTEGGPEWVGRCGVGSYEADNRAQKNGSEDVGARVGSFWSHQCPLQNNHANLFLAWSKCAFWLHSSPTSWMEPVSKQSYMNVQPPMCYMAGSTFILSLYKPGVSAQLKSSQQSCVWGIAIAVIWIKKPRLRGLCHLPKVVQ